ncbi:uncharacterized protein L201_006462 [Kwoniella dendrophila CBS 6074]|uniref:AB hydrolase-1 domain-containing protein n=1 Tax=Kwoniella dendrophila CBS 6074 TaxID=1295534 RepID=A0AAX4K1B0_9TREE
MVLAGLVSYLFAYSVTQHTNILQITNERNLNCGAGDNKVTNGYVNLKNGNLFFSLFQGKGEAKHNGLVIQFEGGPGATAFDYPFIGAGPCQLVPDGEPSLSGLVPAPYPWTDYANLLVVDYPIGAGWSYNTSEQNPGSTSDTAAEEFDDSLQIILKQWPKFQDQPIILSTLSYGGTTGSHIASTVLKRNNEAKENFWSARIIKQFDQLLFGNPFADAMSEIYAQWDVVCNTEPKAYNETICSHFRDDLTKCLDKLRYLDEIENTGELRLDAMKYCVQTPEIRFELPIYNRYHKSKPKCFPSNLCFWWMGMLTDLMNSQEMREWLGVTNHIERWWYAGPAMFRFINNADHMQNAYKLLQPVLESGTRLLVYSGLEDTMVPYIGTESWMNRLPNPYLKAFRESETQKVSNDLFRGTVINPGSDLTLIGIDEAGHLVEETHAALTQEMIRVAVQGKNYNPI